MASASVMERAALDEMEPRLLRQGYRLVRHPSRDQLPAFLRGFEPDAIAVGATPSLVIEIVNPQSRASRTKVSQISSLFENQEEWRLEILYAPSETGEISLSSIDSIARALDDSERLLQLEPKAALLLGWAALEGAARHLHPSLAPQGLTGLSLIELLVSQGDVPPDDQVALRKIARKRNAIAHGDLATAVASEEVLHIVRTCRHLLEKKRKALDPGGM